MVDGDGDGKLDKWRQRQRTRKWQNATEEEEEEWYENNKNLRKVYHNYKLCVNNKSWPKRGKAQSSAAAVTFFVDGWRSNSAPWSGWWWWVGGEGVRHTSNYRGSTQFYFSLLFDFNSNFQMALQANENPYPRGLLWCSILLLLLLRPAKKKSVLHPQTYPQVHTTSPPCRRWHKKRRWWFSGWLVGCSVLVTCGKRGKAREPKPAGSFC